MGSEHAEPEQGPAPATSPQTQTPQRPLVVGAAHDRVEHEADELADTALAFLSARTGEGRVRRSERAPAAAQGPGVGAEGGLLDQATTQRIRRATNGGGRPLAAATRDRMERGFGADFSRVRVHDDREAASLSSELNAHAFTLGSDIFLGAGAEHSNGPDGERVLAHELAHVVQHDRGVHRMTIRRRAYDNLAPTQRAQVDAIAENEYYQQAKMFEVNLGREIARSSKATGAARDLSKRVRKLVDAWVVKIEGNTTQAGKDARYEAVFGTLDATNTGAIPKFAEDIKAVLDRGSLRERLTIVYSAIRSDYLQMMLNVAYRDANAATATFDVDFRQPDNTVTNSTVTRGLSKAAGLQSHLSRNDAVRGEIGTRTNPAAPVNDRSQLFGRKQLVTQIEQTGEKQRAGTDETATTNIRQRQTVEESGLSERELRAQVNLLRGKQTPPQGALTRAAAATSAAAAGTDVMSWLRGQYANLEAAAEPGAAQPGATPTQWVSGEQWYRAQADSALAVHASKIKATLRAATSGTTDMFLHAAQYLGMDSASDLRKVRLAMLAWMLPARDHSFYEIMTSATQYGLNDFDPDAELWAAYEQPIAPLGSKVNKRAIPPPTHGAVPRDRFPGWYLSPPGYPGSARGPRFKDIVANDLAGHPMMVRGPNEIGVFTAAGVPVGAVEQVDDATLALLKTLAGEAARLRLDHAVAATNDATYNAFMASAAVTNVVAAMPKDGRMIACVLVDKLHPYVLPPADQAQLARARVLTPMGPDERMSPAAAAAVDPQTAPGLQRPMMGAGSGKRMAELAYDHNRQQFIDDVLEFQNDRYDAHPDQMNAWFEVFQRKHGDAFPEGDLDLLRALNTARTAAAGTPNAPLIEAAFDNIYQRVFGLHKLTDAEKAAVNMYTVSSVANDLNAAAKGNQPMQGDVAQTAEVLLTALEKLPAYTGGPVYRGDANRGYQVGRVMTYNEFVSTSKTVKSSFVNQQNKNWCTHALVVEKHRSGKDVMALSDYSRKQLREMEGEILFPPGTRFVVKRIEDWSNLADPLGATKAELAQIMTRVAAGTASPADLARKTELQKQVREVPARSQLFNKVWVYLDEV